MALRRRTDNPSPKNNIDKYWLRHMSFEEVEFNLTYSSWTSSVKLSRAALGILPVCCHNCNMNGWRDGITSIFFQSDPFSLLSLRHRWFHRHCYSAILKIFLNSKNTINQLWIELCVDSLLLNSVFHELKNYRDPRSHCKSKCTIQCISICRFDIRTTYNYVVSLFW